MQVSLVFELNENNSWYVIGCLKLLDTFNLQEANVYDRSQILSWSTAHRNRSTKLCSVDVYTELEQPQRSQAIPLITVQFKVARNILRQKDSCLQEISTMMTSVLKHKRRK